MSALLFVLLQQRGQSAERTHISAGCSVLYSWSGRKADVADVDSSCCGYHETPHSTSGFHFSGIAGCVNMVSIPFSCQRCRGSSQLEQGFEKITSECLLFAVIFILRLDHKRNTKRSCFTHGIVRDYRSNIFNRF